MIWSDKQRKIISAPFEHCLEVNEGTPRSSKTTACVFRFARHLIESRDENHLIVAYSQEQAYRLVMECDGFGLIHIFNGLCRMKHDDNGDHLEVTTPNGTKKVYYKGGGKADSRKAITGLSLGSVYFCEIDLLHMEMIQECFRRTFAAIDRWHIADLNPPSPQHPVITQVFDIQDTKWTHWTVKDNPIITEERKKEIYNTLVKNKYLFERDWEGKRTIPQGVIYSMFDVSKHIASSVRGTPIEMFFSGDGGLTDATSIGCYVISNDGGKYILNRVANWFYNGTKKAMSVQAREIEKDFVRYCRNKTGRMESFFFVDPACKALRMELELLGVQTNKADNNARDIKGNTKGIKVGIEYLQSAITDGRFFCVNDDRFGHENFIQEIGMYCVDQHGNPIDAYNHCMDETRYACNYFYKNYVL